MLSSNLFCKSTWKAASSETAFLFIKFIPVQYEGVKAEHDYVRNSIDIFDDSHMGEFVLKRENTIALLQKVTSSDTSIMVVGQEQ